MTKSHNYKFVALGCLVLTCVNLLHQNSGSQDRGGGLATPAQEPRPQFPLAMDNYWRLGASKKERFDASGLLLREGKILTVNDRQSNLYEIVPGKEHTAEMRPTAYFTASAMAKAFPGTARYDTEGITSDNKGNLYICEESRRAVFRSGSDGGHLEKLPIDWDTVSQFFKGGPNASFEGIAIGDGKLYVANERDAARIIVVGLNSLKVEGSFAVDSTGFALGGPHYSDLAFFGGRLFVLDRNHRCILEVDPATKKVAVEYNFGEMEINEEFAYLTDYPTGTMEGLAVDENYFWLITDNNGRSRFKARDDFRPTLFRCKRPTKK